MPKDLYLFEFRTMFWIAEMRDGSSFVSQNIYKLRANEFKIDYLAMVVLLNVSVRIP